MKNKLDIVVVGIDGWWNYTYPLILSVEKYEPSVRKIIVDNASEKPYPEFDYVIRSDERLSYAAAINLGIIHTDSDWILSINNDVLCQGPFISLLEGLDLMTIYARQLISENGIIWFGNWIVLLSQSVWKAVGEFDPGFRMCGFEDADYSIRSRKLGIPVKFLDLPFMHLWGRTRWGLPGYPSVREENRKYLLQKHGLNLGGNMVVLSD